MIGTAIKHIVSRDIITTAWWIWIWRAAPQECVTLANPAWASSLIASWQGWSWFSEHECPKDHGYKGQDNDSSSLHDSPPAKNHLLFNRIELIQQERECLHKRERLIEMRKFSNVTMYIIVFLKVSEIHGWILVKWDNFANYKNISISSKWCCMFIVQGVQKTKIEKYLLVVP